MLNTISLCRKIRHKASELVISSSQIRAARALLGISAEELGQMADIPHRTIQRFETAGGIPPSRSGTLERVQRALEDAGIEFIGDPVSSPGVRLRRRTP